MIMVKLDRQVYNQRELGILSVYVVQVLKYQAIPEHWPREAANEALQMLLDVGITVSSFSRGGRDVLHDLLQFFINRRKSGRLPPVLRGSGWQANQQLLLFGDMFDLTDEGDQA